MVGNSPLAARIKEVLKKHGKAMDAAAVIVAIGKEAKPATVKNYLSRMVSEGVISRPERGMFAIK
jgi:hypothetical protein